MERIDEQKKQKVLDLAADFCHRIQIANAIIDVDYPGTGDLMIDALVKGLEKLRKQPEQSDTCGAGCECHCNAAEEKAQSMLYFDFGDAIKAVKAGYSVARKGWNGKHQFVELATCISYKGNAGEIVNCHHNAIGNKALAFIGTSGVQMGWLASQADMLADDWYIVK